MSYLKEYGEGIMAMLDTYSEVIQKRKVHGIDVYASQEDDSRLTNMHVHFYHGSFADNIPGVHHALEHMMFKGKNANLVKQMEALGASLNAYTSIGHTVFTMECSSKKAFDIIPIFADMFKTGEDGFDVIESEWELEKSVIQSERIQSANDHYCNVADEVAKNLYAEGVNINVLGDEADINRITVEDLKKTYNEMVYVENMSLVIKHGVYCNNLAGRMTELLSERIPSMPDRDRLNGYVFAPSDRTTDKVLGIKKKNVHCVDYNLYARLDLNPMNPLHDVLINLMSCYIGGGLSSPLFVKIRDELGGVYSCGSYIYNGAIIGANLGLCVGINAEDPSEHFRACGDILRDLKENGMTEEGFEKAKNRVYYRNAKNGEAGEFNALHYVSDYRADKVYVTLHYDTILDNLTYEIANRLVKEILNERLLSTNITIVYPEGDEVNA